jgi:hypothetical protein
MSEKGAETFYHMDREQAFPSGNVQLYLTRRNLETLLSMLDARREGALTVCRIVKNDTSHPTYPCSRPVSIYAIEDEDYYTDRGPGEITVMPDAE